MKRSVPLLATLVSVSAMVLSSPAHAQQGGVGGLQIVGESGETLSMEPAPPGEKLFRLPSGTDAFRVAFDFEGTGPTDVQLRVMGSSGTVLFQETDSYDTTGSYEVAFDNEGVPLEDQEYVVNAYIGPEFYLADSLQLIVGEAELLGSTDQDVPAPRNEASALSDANLAPQSQDVTAATEVPDIPGGPSWQLLVLAGLGVLALAAIVVWAGWSALRRT